VALAAPLVPCDLSDGGLRPRARASSVDPL